MISAYRNGVSGRMNLNHWRILVKNIGWANQNIGNRRW